MDCMAPLSVAAKYAVPVNLGTMTILRAFCAWLGPAFCAWLEPAIPIIGAPTKTRAAVRPYLIIAMFILLSPLLFVECIWFIDKFKSPGLTSEFANVVCVCERLSAFLKSFLQRPE
jgi:hypothetical protein